MQVSGLTRLMMEGKKDEAGGAGGRRENRRETWAPGIAGGAALSTAVDACLPSFPSRQQRPYHAALHDLAYTADRRAPLAGRAGSRARKRQLSPAMEAPAEGAAPEAGAGEAPAAESEHAPARSCSPIRRRRCSLQRARFLALIRPLRNFAAAVLCCARQASPTRNVQG